MSRRIRIALYTVGGACAGTLTAFAAGKAVLALPRRIEDLGRFESFETP